MCVYKCADVDTCGDRVMYKLELQDVTKRTQARGTALKKCNCLCLLWNEVRPVLTLNVPTCLFLILHFCTICFRALLSKGFCVCVQLCHVPENYLCEKRFYSHPDPFLIGLN